MNHDGQSENLARIEKQHQDIERFILRLQTRVHSATVFNPYRDPALVNNLRHYLRAMIHWQGERCALLVGEAPGYRGCRLTGIPFSSGELLLGGQHRFFRELAPRLDIAVIEKEASASMVWECLERRRNLPLFWNTFPFHPHREGKAQSNRAPVAQEIREGRHYLEMLIEIYQPQCFAAVGRAAENALGLLFPAQKVRYIRHPSYGGKSDFVAGMKRFLK